MLLHSEVGVLVRTDSHSTLAHWAKFHANVLLCLMRAVMVTVSQMVLAEYGIAEVACKRKKILLLAVGVRAVLTFVTEVRHVCHNVTH
jgi:hypothetical protein